MELDTSSARLQSPSNSFAWTEALLLHLVPGVVITLAFVGLAWLTAPLGWPPSLALLMTWLVAGIPLLLGILFHQGRRMNGIPSLQGILLYRQPLPWRQYAWLIPVLLVWSALASTLLFPLGESIRHLLLPAWPEWLNLSALAQDPAR